MKQQRWISLMIWGMILIGLTSCKKDPCKTTTCLNGGVCDNGQCDCPPGYSGAECEYYDTCYGVKCQNGGNCINGQCKCPEGYTGPDCSLQATPVKIYISRIDIIRFPATDQGAGWDVTSGPDIYPILLEEERVKWNSNRFLQNASPNAEHYFIPDPAILIDDPNGRYTLRVMDYDDFDAHDFMGGIYFSIYDKTNGFPAEKIIDAEGAVAFRLHLKYVW